MSEAATERQPGVGVWVCPTCFSDDVGVVDSRPIDSGIRRRRRCFACNMRWSTVETFLWEGRKPDLRWEYDIAQSLERMDQNLHTQKILLSRLRRSALISGVSQADD